MRLIISRSSEYGLRDDQPRIDFQITPPNSVTIRFYDPKNQSYDNIECDWRYLYKDVSLFERLLGCEVD
jgi:hypothetical protein